MSLNLFKSTRGNIKVGYKDYSYRKGATTKQTVNWRCDRKDCSGSLVTTSDLTDPRPKLGQSHNHEPNQIQVNVKVAAAELKELAKCSFDIGLRSYNE